jgi:phage tail-like protein
MLPKSNDDFTILTLNSAAKWQAQYIAAHHLRIGEDGLTLRSFFTYAFDRVIGKPEGVIKPTDLAVDRCGMLFILDGQQSRIAMYDPPQDRLEWIECIGGVGELPTQFTHPEAIAVTDRTLYIADAGNRRVIAFARLNWQVRWIVEAAVALGSPPEVFASPPALALPMEPRDLAVDADGNLYVLDSANLVVQKFDPGGRVVQVIGQGQLVHPVTIAIDNTSQGDSVLYVLDAAWKSVLQYTAAGEFLGEVINLQNAALGFLEPFGLAVDQQGHIYLGDQHTLAPGDEDDRFIYPFDTAGTLLSPAITAYRGRTDSLVTDQHYNLYILNREREDITLLKRQEKFPLQGTYISKAFDSTMTDCRWHKVVVNSAVTEKTQVRISYFISAEHKSDEDMTELADDEWSKPLLNPPDALILSPSGRYLWLRLELSGDGQAGPVVQSVQTYFQRLSYLRYLPAVYQEDETSRDFLERFLSLFETLFYNLEVQIGHVARSFDPQATPAAFLPWLAQWLAAAVDADWPLEKQRQFLRQAATLYKARGTRRGFEDLIALYTGEKPIIFECFQLRCIQDDELRKVYEDVFGNDPLHFCVLLKPAQVRTDREYFAVKRLVEADKPAHTAAGVRLLQPWFYLDMHTYLGINTHLQKAEMRLEQQSVIGRDSFLTDSDEAGQVERRSRVNMDMILT